uniref:hypothetical protein n=1 Tax=Halocatena marina TaxID=2934937 RepID=UPI00200BBA00
MKRTIPSVDSSPISRIAIIAFCVALLTVSSVSAAMVASDTTNKVSSSNQFATNSTSAKPMTVVEDVRLTYEKGDPPLPFNVDVKKLNESKVAIVYQHNNTTKTWHTTADNVVNHHTLSGDGTENPTLKNLLGAEIEKTNVFKNEMRPYIRSGKSGKKTGVEGRKQYQRELNEENPIYNLPGPVKAAKDIYKWIVDSATNGVSDLIDAFHGFVLSLPAPGEPFKPSTWFPNSATPINNTTSPNNTSSLIENKSALGSQGNSTNATNASSPPVNNTDGWWDAVWTIYGGLTSLVALPMFVSWVYAWSRNTGTQREREQYLHQMAQSVGMIIGGLVVLPLILHLSNELAAGIVPDGNTFIQTPENIAKFGLGLLVGGFITLVESGLIFVGLVCVFVQWVLTFLIVAAWPLFAVCLASGNRYIRPYGESGVVAFGTLIVLKLIQAVWLRLLIELPLAYSDVGTSLLTIVTIMIGVSLGFIYLPYYAVKNLLPEMVSQIGG